MVDIKTAPGIRIRTVMHNKHDLLIYLIVQFTEHVQICCNLLYDALLRQLHSQGRSSQWCQLGLHNISKIHRHRAEYMCRELQLFTFNVSFGKSDGALLLYMAATHVDASG